MAKVTYWTCDHCGKSQTNSKEMVMVSIESVKQTSVYASAPHTWSSALWCEPCCKELGMPIWPDKLEPGVTPPSIEDMVRQIAAE